MYLLSSMILTTPLLYLLTTVVSATGLQTLRSLDALPVLYFTLHRRGGSFSSNDPEKELANLTFLATEVEKVEERFNLTRREVKGNKLVRKARETGLGGKDEGQLMGKVAESGTWYATISLGEPPQEVEMDLDMLASDFYVVITTSREGSRYDDLFSRSNVRSNTHLFPNCGLPTDTFHLPTINISVPLPFAYCRPSKSSAQTLGPSGSLIGLAPSEHLSQLKIPSLFNQLLQRGIIKRPVFSLMLINNQEGVLSIGGTTAGAVELVENQTKEELDILGALNQVKPPEQNGVLSEDQKELSRRRFNPSDTVSSRQADWEDGWRWSKVQGAEGWWQILMQGVWVDGSKVLKNQPVVLDINTPFILAPPLAARSFYASISGSRALPAPHSNFYIFPCLNPPVIHFEFDKWIFPAMQGGKGVDWDGVPGGKFSLGRWREGSGYCVGAVVESRMGDVSEERGQGRQGGGGRGGLGAGMRGWRNGKGPGEVAGNGMRGVWVVGEGFFRGVGAVFDWKNQRVGFRTY